MATILVQPKRPTPAFFLWRAANYQKIIQNHLSNATQKPSKAEVAKYMGSQWQQLPPDIKAEYERKALHAREAYNVELEAFKSAGGAMATRASSSSRRKAAQVDWQAEEMGETIERACEENPASKEDDLIPGDSPEHVLLQFQWFLEDRKLRQNTVAEYERILHALIEQYGLTVADLANQRTMSMVRSGPGSRNVVKHILCVLKHYSEFWAGRNNTQKLLSSAPLRAPEELSGRGEPVSSQSPMDDMQPSLDLATIIPASLAEECRERLGEELQNLDKRTGECTQAVQEEARQLQETLLALQRLVIPFRRAPCVLESLEGLPEPKSVEDAADALCAGCSHGRVGHEAARHASGKLLPEEIDAIDALVKDVVAPKHRRKAKDPSRKLLPEELDAIELLVQAVLESPIKAHEGLEVAHGVRKAVEKNIMLDGHRMRRSKRPLQETHQATAKSEIGKGEGFPASMRKMRRLRRIGQVDAPPN